MKKIWVILLMGIVSVCLCAVAMADVKINATSFPDTVFRSYVKQFDTDNDGSLSNDEIAAVTDINVSYGDGGVEEPISDLTGIEYFTELTDLNCYYNRLKSLDVSNNKALLFLYCGCNQLTDLDLSNNTALIWLHCEGNGLSALDVSKNTNIISIQCFGNRITELDLQKNTALQFLFCENNQLTKIDVSKCPELLQFWCPNNKLTALNVSKNTKLDWLWCSDNSITKLNVSNIPALSKLVKETTPGNHSWQGYGWWQENDYGEPEPGLFVDENVKVITDQAEQIDISKAKVTAIKAQTYTGKAIKPTVTVKYDGKKLTKDKDYTVAYKNNKKIGSATVTITGKGNYTGKKTVKFDIIPKGVKLSSLTAGKKKLTVTWAKGSGITGYEIEYSLKKNFKDKKTVTIKKAATTKTVLKKLEAKKTYYIRIRTYKTVNGKKYYSAWSAIKNKKTK